MARILHFLDQLNLGGSESLVLEIVRNGFKSKNEIIFAAGGVGTLENEFRGSETESYFFKRRFPVDPFLVRQLRRLIVRRSIDIVHGYQPVEILHLWLATRGLGTKLVHSYQGGGWILESTKNRILARFLDKRVDVNLTCTEAMKLDIAKLLGKASASDFRVVYNAAKTAKTNEESALREELGLRPNDLLGGMIANFVGLGNKDQMTVCVSLASLMEEFPSLNFVFVGHARNKGLDDLRACEELCAKAGIENRVHFLGRRTDVPSILAGLDYFVLSSRHEGFGIAAAEAMLASVPAILSDIPPLVEVSGKGKYALLFETGNPNDLTSKTRELFSDRDKTNERTIEAKNFAESRFTIDAHIRSLDQIYEELIE